MSNSPTTIRRQICRGRSRRNGGFTLIEMVVAAILLAIGATAALNCITTATRSTSRAKEYSTAALLSQRKFGELESNPMNISTGDQSGDFGNDYPGWSFDQNVETSDLNGALRVTMTIKWPAGGSAQFISFEPNPNVTAPTDNSPSSSSGSSGGSRP